MNLEEWHWKRLLAAIERREVIPVIGPELLTVEIDGQPVSLYRHLARELVKSFDLDVTRLGEAYGFHDVICECLIKIKTCSDRYQREDLYDEIRTIMDAQTVWKTPEPLKKLAEITHFQLFISTTFDSLMERALNEARFGGGEPRTCSLAYGKRDKVADLPDGFMPDGKPRIYHFFGKLNKANDFAVTDEDILQYSHRLQSRECQPRNLFDQFRGKRLLTLGCSLPGWLTRFFLAAAFGEELFSKDGVSGILADDLSPLDSDLVGFLERNRIDVYTQDDAAKLLEESGINPNTRGGATRFVNELHRRWIAKFGSEVDGNELATDEGAPSPSAIEPDSVFISFRREDRDAAREIAAKFQEARVAVFFDEHDLSPGDLYQEKIESHINSCFAFVPLISRHSILQETKRWFYRFEWNTAIEVSKFFDESAQFILPVLLDETDPYDERIPPKFRKLQICRLDALEKLIDQIKARIRDKNRERRPG